MSAEQWPQTARSVGDRLREARRRAEMSQEQLAHGIGSRQATISSWENGHSFPGLPDLFRICHVLGLEVYELLPPRLMDEPPPALMRAIAAEIPAGQRFRAALELFLHRAALMQVPETEVRVRRGTPEQMARSGLRWVGVKAPPVNPESLARRVGVRVVGWEGLVDSISGLLVEFAEGPLIVINLGHPISRQRFTIAHELGHHLLKHIEQFHVDLAAREEAGTKPDYDRTNENEANRFAAELLMPADWVKNHVRETKDIESLAEAFAVSDIAMGYRLMGLGLKLADPTTHSY